MNRWVIALVMLVMGVACSGPGAATSPSPTGWLEQRPGPGRVPTWVIQLDGVPAQQADLVTLDGQDTTPAQVAQVVRAGGHPICYLNAGAWEQWRPDAGRIPPQLVGKPLAGWPGERWLDVRDPERLRPVMADRIETCRRKGFVAVDPDNLDGHSADTGWGISQAQEFAYLSLLIELAHGQGLAIGLKNAVELLPKAGPKVDFAVNESCHELDECARYADFVSSGKWVLNLEYRGTPAEVCQPLLGFITVLAERSLAGPVRQCR